MDFVHAFSEIVCPEEMLIRRTPTASDQITVPKNYSAAFLSALLLNPKTEKEPTEQYDGCYYTIDENGFIRFQPTQSILNARIRKDAPNQHYVNVHHPLFLVGEWLDTYIDVEVCQRLIKHEKEEFLLNWVRYLPETSVFDESCVIELRDTFATLQRLLQRNQTIMHRELFKKINPLLYYFYWPKEDASSAHITVARTLDDVFKEYKLLKTPVDYGTMMLFQKMRTVNQQSNMPLTLEKMVQLFLNTITNLDHVTSHKAKRLFATVAQSMFWEEDRKDQFHQSWRDRALAYADFGYDDDGLLMNFCRILGVHTSHLLHKIFNTVHNGTLSNLRILCDHGVDLYHVNHEGKTVLTRLFEKRIELTDVKESEHKQRIDRLWLTLIEKGAGYDVDVQCALSVYKQIQREEIDPEEYKKYQNAFHLLAQRNPPFQFERLTSSFLSVKNDYAGERVVRTLHGVRVLDDVAYERLYRHGEFKPQRGNHSNGFDKREGTRSVGYLINEEQKGLCFKKSPEFPMIEHGIYAFMKGLFGYSGTPYAEILRMGERGRGDVLLMSPFINGRRLDDVLTHEVLLLDQLDLHRLGELIITSILTNPEDGRPQNYMVVPSDLNPRLYKIIAFDNDHSFAVATQRIIQESAIQSVCIQGNCVLFCLGQMSLPLHESIQKKLMDINIDVFFDQWLKELEHIEAAYNALFVSEDEAGCIIDDKSYYESEQIILTMPLTYARIKHVHDKIHTLQSMVRDFHTQGKIPTYMEILQELESTMGRRYGEASRELTSIYDRFKKTDGRKTSTVSTAQFHQSLKPIHNIPFKSIREIRQAIEDINHENALIFSQTHEAFIQLSPGGQMRLFERLPQLGDAEQQAWLTLIGDYIHEWSRFRVSGYSSLTVDRFERFNLYNMVEISINLCDQVDNYFFTLLSQSCRNLEILRARQLVNLDEISFLFNKQGYIMADRGTPINLGRLKILNLTNMDNLQNIFMEVPQLRQLEITSCPKLLGISIESLSKKSKHRIKKINLRENPILSRDSVLGILNSQSESIDELILDDCYQIEERELLELVKDPAIYNSVLSIYNIRFRKHIIDLYLNKCGNALNISGINDVLHAIFYRNMFSFDTIERMFELSHSQINPIKSQALTQALTFNNSLQWLDLSNNDLGDEGAALFADLLHINKVIKVLNLSGNNIGDDGAISLASSLFNNTTLTVFYLNNNDIHRAGAHVLGSMLRVNKALKVIHLNDNPFEIDGAEFIINALEDNNALQWLDFNNNQMGEECALSFSNVLTKNKTLQVIGILNNNITEIGVSPLARTLKFFSSLVVIALSDNKIGVEGTRLITEALKSNKTLQWLDFNKNKIGDKGATYLAESLYYNDVIQGIEISDNEIGNEGSLSFSTALSETHNTSLEWLDLSYNTINDLGASTFVTLLRENTSMKVLNLRRNSVGREITNEVSSYLQRNTKAELFVETSRLSALNSSFKDSVYSQDFFRRSSSYKTKEKDIWETLEKEDNRVCSIEYAITEWHPVLFVLQGEHQYLLSFLRDLDSYLQSVNNQKLINLVNTWAGSGNGGILALALLKSKDNDIGVPDISISESDSLFNRQNSGTLFENYKRFLEETTSEGTYSVLEKKKICLSEVMKPISLSFITNSSSSASSTHISYDSELALEDERTDIPLIELAKIISESISTDPTISGLDLLKRIYSERAHLNPIIISLGVSDDSLAVHRAVRSSLIDMSNAIYIRPYLFTESANKGSQVEQIAMLLHQNQTYHH